MLAAVNFDSLTLVEAVSLLHSGTVTSEQLVQHYIRCAGVRPELCAFAAVDATGALKQAREADAVYLRADRARALEGVPILVKENIHVRGLPNRAGTPGLAHFEPAADAAVIATLREAGAVLYATSHMHELAWGVSGFNPLASCGSDVGVRNAYNVHRVSGGSSSGNGAALGARLALIALGTDTGGSVRIPAAANGVCGLRPTFDRYSQQGITPCCLNRDTIGPMAHTVADLELIDRVISKEPPLTELPPLDRIRLGVLRPMVVGLDNDTDVVFTAALQRLRACGTQLIDIESVELVPLLHSIGLSCTLYEAYNNLASYLSAHRPAQTVEQLIAAVGSSDVKALWQSSILPANMDRTDLRLAGETSMTTLRPALRRLYASLMKQHNVAGLVFPTLPCVPVLAEPVASDFSTFMSMTRHMAAGSLSGFPGITLPIGIGAASRMPIGLAIDGMPNSDRQLLGLGMALERVFGRLIPPEQR